MYFSRLANLRIHKGYRQKEVAAYLTMHPEVYGRYEKGVREIPVWALLKLSELYGVSVDYILGLTDNPGRNA